MLFRSVYIRYIWWFPCQKYRIYTVYIGLARTVYIYTVHTAYLVVSLPKIPYIHRIYRVGKNRIYIPYKIAYLVVSLPKIPFMRRKYTVLASPSYEHYGTKDINTC